MDPSTTMDQQDILAPPLVNQEDPNSDTYFALNNDFCTYGFPIFSDWHIPIDSNLMTSAVGTAPTIVDSGIQHPPSPNMEFETDNLNYSSDLTDSTVCPLQLNSTFNPDFSAFLGPMFFSSTSVDSSTISGLTSSIGLDTPLTQLSSPKTISVSDEEMSPRRNTKLKTKPKTMRKANNRPRKCDLNREKRKIEKPEACPECPRRFAWKRDRNRHLISQHPEKAVAMGFSLEELRCEFPSCKSKFTRRDRVLRHMNDKHGRVPFKRSK